MSSEEGETGDGGGDSGGTPTAEAIVDSTVKILLPQLANFFLGPLST
jgi:hypothetical protein